METMIINGEEWVRKTKQEPTPSSPSPEDKPDEWKTLFDKFCDGDCPRCTIFNGRRHDLRQCEIIWLQDYASVPTHKKEEYLVKINEYIKQKRDRVILDAEQEQKTADRKADDCARALADAISLVCDSTTATGDIPQVIFRMLDLMQDTVRARQEFKEATERLTLIHEEIKEGKL